MCTELFIGGCFRNQIFQLVMREDDNSIVINTFQVVLVVGVGLAPTLVRQPQGLPLRTRYWVI